MIKVDDRGGASKIARDIQIEWKAAVLTREVEHGTRNPGDRQRTRMRCSWSRARRGPN
jgi:hypothetical protein